MSEPSPSPDGCRLCGSTWGNVWLEVEGRLEFFCCDVCAEQWKTIGAEIRRSTGWPSLDQIEIEGNRWGRRGTANRGSQKFQFFVVFTPEGRLRRFEARPGDQSGVPPTTGSTSPTTPG